MSFKKINRYSLNFGPQHPSAHGVLRLMLTMSGEKILRAIPHIGLLHRGTEKLMEYKTFIQGLPYLDRLDYVSMMSQEHAYSMSIENLLDLEISKRASAIRVMFIEMTRILNHLMAVTTHALDVGALNPFLWGSEEREKLMEFYERVSGARMHAAYIRPGGVAFDIPLGLLNDIYEFIFQFNSRINEIEMFLTNNRIWKQRLIGVGILDTRAFEDWSLSGVMARSIGLKQDLRINYPYDIYNDLEFHSIFSKNGDSFDRYLIRIEEMKESAFLINQCLNLICSGSIKSENEKITFPRKVKIMETMESVISHFKNFTDGVIIEEGKCYVSVEAPKGEFGVFLITNNFNKPHRCKFRAPGFYHLQALDYMAFNVLLADLVAIIGTQDIVFGEIDR